jgi:hypothetical protein
MRAHLCSLHALLLAVLVLACQSSPPPAPKLPPSPAERAAAFQPERAWAHLDALAQIGPRVMGTEGGSRARAYIRGELETLGLEIKEQKLVVRRGEDAPQIDLVNVAARVPGASSDLILLLAPYDTRPYENFRFLGVNDGGSGAALLLEMARVLVADPLPYTTWIVFLDGEAPLESGESTVAPSYFGSLGLARRLAAGGGLAQIRLALVLNRVCDADLRIARDLYSHRIYREEFWRAAVRLGRTDAFPPGAGFESPLASHHGLSKVGLRRVVALVDTSFGGDEPPGLYAGTEDDDLEHCSADSLAAVGLVTLEALDTIARRLAKIDRFAESPLEAGEALVLDTLEVPPDEGTEVPPEAEEPADSSAQEGAEEPTEEPPATSEAIPEPAGMP